MSRKTLIFKLKYDTEKLNIDIPLYSLEEPLELKVPVVYVLL